ESIYFRPFNSIHLKKFYIEDHDRDTLLFVDELLADLDFSSIWNNKLTIDGIEIRRGKVFVKKNLDSTTNFTFIQTYFKPEEEVKQTKSFELILSDVTFEDMDLRYRNLLADEKDEGINFNDLHIYDLSGKLEDIDYVNHIFQSKIYDLTFKEKAGVFVKRLTTNATVDSNRMEFAELDLAMNTSYLRDYILFEYDDFSAFSDFINRVNVKGTLRNSRVLSKDIGLFAPQVNVTNFDV